jgi:dolichol kinase
MSNNPSIIWEFLRKGVHLSGLLIVVAYTVILHLFSERIAILSMTAVLLVLLEIEYVRLEHKPKIAAMFDGLFRKHEQDNISGAVFLLISCIICFAAFDYWIAVVALFMTVFGDLFAALVGRAWGKTTIYNNKTLVGTLAGFAANVIVGILILPGYFYLIGAMAFVATFTELITNKMDDNLTVPLFAGFAGQMIIYFFELPLPPIEFSLLGFF